MRMAITSETTWIGGSIGQTPNLTREPMFSFHTGTESNATYVDAIGGETGQAVRTNGLSRAFTLSVSGTHWRRAFRVARRSGVASAGQAVFLLIGGGVNRGDIFLRNQNGGNWTLRGGAGGTTYFGQQSVVAGENSGIFRMELEYSSNGTTHTIRLMIYNPGNTTGVPNDIYTGTVAAPIDTIRFLNPTGATGMIMDFGTLWYESTGAPIWESGAAGTLDFVSGLAVNSTGEKLIIAGKVLNADKVEVKFGDQLVTANLDSDGYFKASEVVGTLGRTVNWEILVDDLSARTGSTRTLPSGNTLRILAGSCYDTYTSGFFANADARNPDLIFNGGDKGYFWLSTSPNGPTAPADAAAIRSLKEPMLRASAVQSLFSKYPELYIYSDCDGAGSNSDGTYVGFTSNAVQTAFRQQFALPELPMSDNAGRVIVWKKFRIILTDETTLASAKGSTDNSTKTKLGASQKAWFKQQIDLASENGEAILWVGDAPFHGPKDTSGGTANEWTRYDTERLELVAYMQAKDVLSQIIRFNGDRHSLAADDGTNNPYGGFGTVNAAPFHTTAQPYGMAASEGSYPPSTTNSARQYAMLDLTDNGETLTIRARGYSSTNAAPTEVERYDITYDLTPKSKQLWTGIYVGDEPATGVYVGAEKVWP